MLGIASRDEPSENTLGHDVGMEARAPPVFTTRHSGIVTSFKHDRKRRARWTGTSASNTIGSSRWLAAELQSRELTGASACSL
jgi:hypothetical protein